MINQDYYTLKEAGEFLSIPQKYLENYVKIGNELELVKVGRRKLLSISEVRAWAEYRDYSCTQLDRDDYLKCLQFAIESFYTYPSTSDFGTSQQRDAGKFVSNFIIGKLGELAVANFLRKNFDVDVRLDFDLRDAVVGQDITEIAKPRKGGRVYNPLKFRIAIKTSKMKNVWLIVSRNEVENNDRCSDVYIFSRVDLHLDHLIRILKEHDALSDLRNIIPSFEDIKAQVCGFIRKSELISNPPVTVLPAPPQSIQPSYIIRSGQLHKSKKEWTELIGEL